MRLTAEDVQQRIPNAFLDDITEFEDFADFFYACGWMANQATAGDSLVILHLTRFFFEMSKSGFHALAIFPNII